MSAALLRCSLLVVLTLVWESTYPAEAGQIANIAGRKKISLSGIWQVIIDPYDYYTGGRLRSMLRHPTQEKKSDRLEYGFTNSNTLKVPGDWNTQWERLFFYEGSVLYKRDFLYPRSPSGRTLIYFGAVNYSAEVYLNGNLLGSHEGGFTPFAFECTDAIRSDMNTLVVRVNNARRPERVPAMDFDWWNFGGITRDVFLVEVPQTFIENYSVHLNSRDPGTIEGWVTLNGNSMPSEVVIRIGELEGTSIVRTLGKSTVNFAMRARPRLWSPDNPQLYTVSITAGPDRINERIGFRTVATKGTSILLNGEEVYLRGICLHEEALFTGGRVASVAQAKSLFDYAKELGCNFLRLAHYPHSEDALRLADEMGFLIWSEIPVWQNISFDSQSTAQCAQDQLTEMIVRDRNRASIILWSVSNETNQDKKGRMEFLRSLIDRARRLDSTRLITSALQRQMVNDTTMRFNDPLGEWVDVLAVNEYIGWYDGLPRDCQRFVWETQYNKPHIVSEFGGEAVYGMHADSLTIWSEEYQAFLYRNQLAMLGRIPFISGVSPWILKDFRSPRRLNPDYQEYWNKKGVISNEGQRKQSFFLLQDYYRTKMSSTARP